MLRLNPQFSISAPTASATFSTAGSTACFAILGLVGWLHRGLLARRHAHDVAAFTRELADDRVLVAAAIDDLHDLALRQAARRTDRDARFLAGLQLARGDAEDRFDIDRHHELDAHRARRPRR